ncbi:MAG: HupE/UreJ family protein [Rhizobiales bacterium]|nr:HupE/UreJ family protein [Hyphomicrobiales bacterium]
MSRWSVIGLRAAALAGVLVSSPAFAHHLMGGKMPSTFGAGVLSGLGHPILGLDHLAAIVAVGCLAAAFPSGALLAIGFVVAMLVGVSLHVAEMNIPASEALVALSVIALGAVLALRRTQSPVLVGGLLLAAGLFHGYALGESIAGAEPTPLYAYFIGLAIIQSAIALGVMTAVKALAHPRAGELATVRLIGAGVVGVGCAALMAQIVPGV